MITQSLFENEFIATPDKKAGIENRTTASTACSDFSDNTNLIDLPVLGNQSSVENSQKLIKEFKPCFSSEKKEKIFDSASEVPLFSNKKSRGDRFIPIRSSNKLQLAFSRLHTEIVDKKIEQGVAVESTPEDNRGSIFRDYLRTSLLDYPPESLHSLNNPTYFSNKNLFSYNQRKQKTHLESLLSSHNDNYSLLEASLNMKKTRKIPKIPFKVLDAPALQDDFYLNLLDWSDSNLLSVGLSSCVYLWSAADGKVFKVCDLGNEDMVTSVSWSKRGNHLAVGTNSGEVHIWDINKVKKVRTMEGHSARVGTLAWGKECIVSGSRDKSILLRDVRSHRGYYERLQAHKQEVCGLKWSFDDQMFCSGGNDNKLFIWTPKSKEPIFKSNKHKAAVKALAWSPHQHGLLASGGGTADRCIRFWNAHQGKMTNVVDTGSQVCNLLFSKNVNELVSTHGYTQNQIHVWKYPNMSKIATLTGHSLRVLYLAMSPDGRTIVTGAGDETLRFWDLYPKNDQQKPVVQVSNFASNSIMIR